MHCLITGAAGFLGSWLVRQLLQEGHSVIAVVRAKPHACRTDGWGKDVRIVHGTLEDPESLGEQLAADKINVFFHLAWFGVNAEWRNHSSQISTNVVATIRLWEIARDLGCTHWIGLGSQAEYGPRLGVIQEDLPLQPATAYGVAKLASAMLTAKMAEIANMRHTWVRLAAIYGPGDDPAHLIPSTILTLLAGKKPALTMGEQRWDYLYVEDAAKALARVAATGATGSLNLASGKTVVIRKLVERIKALVDPNLPLGFGDHSYREDQVMHLEPDVGKLRLATGWAPEVSLDEGLRRTVAWYREKSAHAAVDL
jgi:nucleoside-diphosphate-sugar epimerase